MRPGQLSGASPSLASVDPRSDEIPIEVFVALDPAVDPSPDSAVPPCDLTALRPPQGRQEVTRSLVHPRSRYVHSRGRAAEAGGEAGDRVVAINGQSVATWGQMSELVQQSEGKPVTLALDREGRRITVTLEPTWDKSLERYLLGVQKTTAPRPEDVIIKQYPFWDAIVAGTQENLRLAGLTLQVVGRLVTFQLSYKSLGGPIRIAQASAAAAQSGAADFLFFMAFLSMQLGILNLLPIPVLDGGHLFFMGIEAIRRKPVSQRVQGIAIQMGLFLLLFVMLIVTINDIDVVWDWRSLLDKVKAVFS